MPLVFPVIHVGTVTTVLALSESRNEEVPFLSTTKLLAVTGVREEERQL